MPCAACGSNVKKTGSTRSTVFILGYTRKCAPRRTFWRRR